MLGDPDRRILEDRELLGHALREPPQHLDIARQGRRAGLCRGATVAERELGGLDVAVGGAPRDGDDPALAEDRQPSPRLADRHELDLDPGGATPLDLARELAGVALGARDLEGAALGEPEGLARLLGERGELHDRSPRDRGERRGGADLAGEPGRARRGLRGEPGALEQRHAEPAPRQVVSGARAEGARTDDDGVRRLDHRRSLLSSGEPVRRPPQVSSASSRFTISRLGAAPTILSTSAPSLKKRSCGIAWTPKRAASAGCSSTLTLPTVTWSPTSRAISSSTGAIARQGPQHGSQKSITTGRSRRT